MRPRPLPKEYRSLSDGELVARASEELPYRTRAYEELMQRHDRLIFGICLRLVGNRQDAEDLAQDIMLKLFTKLGSFEGRSTFRTWVVQVTRNACKDWLKKRAISKQYASVLAHEPRPEVTVEYREDRLLGLLKELSPTDREILTLRFVADLSIAEIAEAMELGLSAAKMRLYRAMDRLQELAVDTFGDEFGYEQ